MGAYSPLVLAPAEGLGAFGPPAEFFCCCLSCIFFCLFCLVSSSFLVSFCCILFSFLYFCLFVFLYFFFFFFFVFLSLCIRVFVSFCICVYMYLCIFAFLSFCLSVQYNTVQYSMVQYSNRRGGWCQEVAHSIFHSMCGVSVTGAASLVAECGTNILFIKTPHITFKKTFWGTSKNQRLDPKVCADPSWLPISKMV